MSKKMTIQEHLKNPTSASYDAMVEQVAQTQYMLIEDPDNAPAQWETLTYAHKDAYRNDARIHLAAIGITRTTKEKKP